MVDSSRRIFLQKAGVGLATIGASGLVLRSDAVPTQEVNRDQIVIQMAQMKRDTPAKTELKKVVSFPYGTVLQRRSAVQRKAQFARRARNAIRLIRPSVGLRYQTASSRCGIGFLAR